MTFGAGGSTREGTLDTVLEIRREGLAAAPHISCIGASRETLRDVLAQYRGHGIRHLVALRGDLPSGAPDAGEFRYASDLVAFIREETGDWFHIDVAAYPEYHPQARNPEDDLANFERKVKAGADSAITQYFFNADAYWHFVDLCAARGITVPIVAGIMPILSASGLARFSDNCGAEIPRWIRRKLEGFGTIRRRCARSGSTSSPICAPASSKTVSGAALLHAQYRGAHHHHLAAARPLGGFGHCGQSA